MEGYLLKKEGFFAGWSKYYFILHEDMLVFLDKKDGRPVGQIHMKIAKLQPDKKDKLLIQIFNGTNEILLRASSIKDKVQWTNALVNCQKLCLEGRYDQYKSKSGKSPSPHKNANISDARDRQECIQQGKPNWHETLNMKFCSQMFSPDSPFFIKLGHLWELEAQLQEVISLIIPEASKTKNSLIKEYADRISNITELMKEKLTDCYTDMEDTRREMYRVAKQMMKIKEGLFHQKPQNLSQDFNSQRFGNNQSPLKDNRTLYNQSSISPVKKHNEFYQSNHQSPPYPNQSPRNQQLQNFNANNDSLSDKFRPDSENSVDSQLVPRKQITTEENKNLEEIRAIHGKLIPHGLSSENLGVIIGYGDIPVNYTMKMRDGLPALIPDNLSYSIWSILKSAMGKDLTKMTMPIWLNEPISMLQKIAEVTQNTYLMENAINIKDDYRKMGHIAIFLMSQYSAVHQRTRKPFNPILGETYEIIQPTFRFMAEQVSHHPPISAFQLEGKGYYTHGDTDVKNFFWGASLEFRAVGLQHLYLTDTNEHFIIKRPDNSANNIIVGKLYVDVHGKMEITNITKNIKCEINIHRIGWTKKNAYKVEGQVLDQQGKTRFEINGKWNEFLSLKDSATGIEEVLFRINPKPENCLKMYGFDNYACNLNYLDEEMKKVLPPTDCRRRLDQRLMEESKYEEAAAEKHRLEEKQRAMRKIREEMGGEYVPKFFNQVTDEQSGNKMYKFNGEYWERRRNLDYADLPDLF